MEPRVLVLAAQRGAGQRRGLAVEGLEQQSGRTVGPPARLHPASRWSRNDRQRPGQQSPRLRDRRPRHVRPVDLRLQGHAHESLGKPHAENGRRGHAHDLRRHGAVERAPVVLLQQHVGLPERRPHGRVRDLRSADRSAHRFQEGHATDARGALRAGQFHPQTESDADGGRALVVLRIHLGEHGRFELGRARIRR